jgi:hypothetical protein
VWLVPPPPSSGNPLEWCQVQFGFVVKKKKQGDKKQGQKPEIA